MKVEFSPNFGARHYLRYGFPRTDFHLTQAVDQPNISRASTDVSRLEELVEIEEKFAVVRASLQGERVIMKFAYQFDEDIHSLQNEAKRYRTDWATKLQRSNIIPRYLGVFQQPETAENKIACLMLQDCGDALEDELEYLTKGDKLKSMSLLAAVHAAGYMIPHDDEIDEWPIVVRDGSYRLIAIRNLEEHQCEWDGDLKADEIPGPWCDTFKCRSILDRGMFMDFWINDRIKLIRIGPYDWVDTEIPDQATCDKLLEGQAVDEVWNFRLIVDWLEKVRDRIDEGELDIELLKRSIPKLPKDRDTAAKLGYDVGCLGSA